MNDSNDNKSSPKIQDATEVAPPLHTPTGTNAPPTNQTSSTSVPAPRVYKKLKYYTTEESAQIIGVTRKAVEKWRKMGIFKEDIKTHEGIYLYAAERIEQMRDTYRRNWRTAWRGEVETTQEITDTRVEVATVEKEIADAKLFDQLLNQWRDNHKNAPVDPKILAELKDAKNYIENLTAENFNPDDAFNVSIRRKIALCKFYMPQLAATFFNVMRDARDSAKKKIKDSENTTPELKNLANLAPSDIATIVDEVVTTIKRDQKEYQKAVKQKEAEEKDLARWKEKQAKPKNPKLLLSPEQATRLFAMKNTDLYNALRLDYLFNNEIRFLTDCDRWLTFDKDKGIWVKGNAGKNSAILPFAGRLAMMLEENEPNPIDFPDAKKIIRSWQTNICVGAATNLLKGVNRIRITTDDLDNHPNLLNCKNGVIDLYDGKFYEIVDPALLLTQQVNAFYRVGYRNETVDKFLRDILPDEETRAALIRWLGYCITGDVSAEKALFIYGTGGNGKGTLTKLLIILLNDYAASVPVTAVIEAGRLKDAGAATTELNVLEKCRLAIVEELPQGGRLDVAKFKSLTGGDKIPVRRLHEEFHNIDPTHKLMLS
ncbi:MAG: hypothetical protein IJG33_05150, partial [Selenomonadaceae bacterium]|nr:hypothetical protein [Selenomonadaceae bacterium]